MPSTNDHLEKQSAFSQGLLIDNVHVPVFGSDKESTGDSVRACLMPRKPQQTVYWSAVCPSILTVASRRLYPLASDRSNQLPVATGVNINTHFILAWVLEGQGM